MSSKVVELSPCWLRCRPGVGTSLWEKFGKYFKAGFFWFCLVYADHWKQSLKSYIFHLYLLAGLHGGLRRCPRRATCSLWDNLSFQETEKTEVGGSLGPLVCHWVHQYCSETTQGYLRIFRDSGVNALGLLRLHLTRGTCWVAVPRAWQTPALEEIQGCSFSLCLGYLFSWQDNDAKSCEYRRASITLRNLDGKTPSSKTGWSSFWWKIQPKLFTPYTSA